MTKPPKRTQGKRNKKSAPIGFHTWSLDARTQFDELLEDMVKRLHDSNCELLERFDNLLDTMLEEGFRIATERYECFVMFETVTPLVLNIQLPIGFTDGEGPEWLFDLSEMIADEIGMLQNPDGSLDAASREILTKIRTELNRLVAQIDMSLNK